MYLYWRYIIISQVHWIMDATAGNFPTREQRVMTITCYKCGQKDHYKKDFPNSTDTNPLSDQKPTYSSPTTVTEMVTGSYTVPKTN